MIDTYKYSNKLFIPVKFLVVDPTGIEPANPSVNHEFVTITGPTHKNCYIDPIKLALSFSQSRIKFR